MMDRRTFLKITALYVFGIAYAKELPQQKIVINLPSYTLEFYKDGELKARFPCTIGSPETPTPIGKGRIIKKRESVVFRYLSGEKKGQIVRYSYLDPEKRTIKMPYDKMRGLDFTINGRMTGPVIHSTTDYWAVGTAKTHGCISMIINDMLKLYNAVNDLPEIEITYKTIFYKPEKVTIWCDIYSKGTNSVDDLFSVLHEYKVNASSLDTNLIEKNLKIIDENLKEANSVIQSLLSAGKDPKEKLKELSITIPLEELCREIEG